MAEERWERLGAATGIVFVILGVVAYLIVGQPPQPGDTPPEIVGFHVENTDTLTLASYLWGVAGIFFLWFLGSLRSYLRRAEGDTGRLSAVVFGSGLVGGAVYTAGIVLLSAAERPAVGEGGLGGPTGIILLHVVGQQALVFSSFAFVVFAAATAVISGRHRALPAWLGWFSWLVAATTLVGSLAVFNDTGAFAIGGAYASIAFGLFFLWFLALSVILTQRAGRAA